MALLSKKTLIARIRKGRESRKRLVESNLDKGVAYQIRNTRDAHGMTQAELADLIGMTQNNVSRLESPDYGRYTISSLKRLADAFDVALVVRFVPFSEYIDWLSGTPYWNLGLRPEALAVPSFSQEEEHHFDNVVTPYVPPYDLNTPSVVAGAVGVAIASATIDPVIPTQGSSPELLGSFYSIVKVPTTASGAMA
jgi:transcriptional regulator with XRE-family HTH domain